MKEKFTFKGFMKRFWPFALAGLAGGLVVGIMLTRGRNLEQKVKEKTAQVQTANFDYQVQAKPQKKINYRTNDFSQDNDTILLARTLYGEARGELDNKKYIEGAIGSIKTRAKRSGKSIKEVVLEAREKKIKTRDGTKTVPVWQYTCFDPRDVNYEKIKNPEEKLFQRCCDVAEEAMKRNSWLEVTNYFVGQNPEDYRTLEEVKEKGIPSWAYLKGENGKFLCDKKGNLIPRKPVAVTDVNLTRRNPKIRAYFYDFGNRF